jgi:hypothetical protein
MNIREFFYKVIEVAKKIMQQISYQAPNLDAFFEEHYFLEFYYLYPNVSSATFSSKTNIPQIKIDQYTMKKYGLDFFQLCNKLRIHYFLSKELSIISRNNFTLKGTGFSTLEDFNTALKLYAPISLN